MVFKKLSGGWTAEGFMTEMFPNWSLKAHPKDSSLISIYLTFEVDLCVIEMRFVIL